MGRGMVSVYFAIAYSCIARGQWLAARQEGTEARANKDELDKGSDVLTDPVEDWGKTEFAPVHRANDECVSILGFYLDVKAVPAEEDIGGSESDALIAVEEAMVVAERLHQRGSFFFDGIVITNVRTKNGGLNRALIADTVETAKHLD
jgi:hypothetical protein